MTHFSTLTRTIRELRAIEATLGDVERSAVLGATVRIAAAREHIRRAAGELGVAALRSQPMIEHGAVRRAPGEARA